jgi:hypothetical protein
MGDSMTNTNEALKALDEIEIAIEQLCKLTNRKFKDTLGYQRIETIRAALSQLRELQADYVLVRKADIPEGLGDSLEWIKSVLDGTINQEKTVWPVVQAADILNAANGGLE